MASHAIRKLLAGPDQRTGHPTYPGKYSHGKMATGTAKAGENQTYPSHRYSHGASDPTYADNRNAPTYGRGGYTKGATDAHSIPKFGGSQPSNHKTKLDPHAHKKVYLNAGAKNPFGSKRPS